MLITKTIVNMTIFWWYQQSITNKNPHWRFTNN